MPSRSLPVVEGAPPADLSRSTAARRVGELAARSGLFLFDYEARVQLELPEHWLPVNRPDLGVTGRAPIWNRGALAESKYLSFRHDLMIGSLHAGHRAKWTAHELAHRLVGFAWHAEGSTLFHALAARAAEALPVVLWYFLDEADARRCPRHADQRELGPGFCPACEAAASAGARAISADDLRPADWLVRGGELLARELDGVRRSLARGRPVHTPHGAIDLMSDGLAYASAHLERLRSPEMQGFIARFHAPERGPGGWHDTLEGLLARVEAVALALVDDKVEVTPWAGGRWRWIAQDLGWRLLQVGAETDGECFAELDRLVDALAADGVDEERVARVMSDYEALYDEFELPLPEDLFAVGYPLPHGLGRSSAQLSAGLETACPAALRALGDLAEATVVTFTAQHAPERRPLGERFAAFLTTRFTGDPELGDVPAIAAFEAAIAHARPADADELALGWDGADPEAIRLATGVALVRAPVDVAAIVLAGVDRSSADAGPRSWLVRRDAAEEVGLTAITEAAAELVARLPLPAAEVPDDPEIEALVAEGFLVPDRWTATVDLRQGPPDSQR
ncbi:MAG: hypothetical protein IT385_29275 [Deltaproteobacteria bacterium]|nr:hypothetical protein [Deltaproteobacteria bacterium]